MKNESITDVVKEKYGQAALRVTAGKGNACCGSAPSASSCVDPITSGLYDAAQTGVLPEEAVKASLGCGNPTALAELKSGVATETIAFEPTGEVVVAAGDKGGKEATARPCFCPTAGAFSITRWELRTRAGSIWGHLTRRRPRG